MKKALKVLSTVMAAGMLAACGSTAASSTATSATSTAESTAESTAASSDEAVTLRLGHTQPTDHQVNITAERFAELVNEYSGGSVTVEVYPNSTFGSASEMNAAVQSGDLDLYVNASAQFASQYEPMTVVDAWYMFNDTDHLMKFYSPDCEVYQTLCEGLKEACNIDSLAPIYYGARHMTANTPLNSVSDLKGRRCVLPATRCPPLSLRPWAPLPPPLLTTRLTWPCSRTLLTAKRTPLLPSPA